LPDVVLLGLTIGTTSMIEQADTMLMLYDDFVPNELGKSIGLLPADVLEVDFRTGTLLSLQAADDMDYDTIATARLINADH